MRKGKIEILIHLLLWAFLFSSLNVNWTANWFDPGIRPNTPAPLSVMIFALYFYTNAFYLLPKYFSFKTWKKYAVYAFLLFILPELLRILLYKTTFTDSNFESLLFSRDSFLFGMPSPFFIAINASFMYRFTKDRFFTKDQGHKQGKAGENKTAFPYEDITLLTEEETHELKLKINHQLHTVRIYLNPELTLRDVAEAVGSTEKKVSYLINQNLQTNFYELINSCRVEKFKTEVAKPENKSLSIVGIAFNCGFPSKSSFYRAFKAQVSMSPSEYIEYITKSR